MGNIVSGDHNQCTEKCNELIYETKSQLSGFNPFSQEEKHVPYAEPLETNIFAPSKSNEELFQKVISEETLKVPEEFETDESYEYDEKFWKRENPNIVIQGHWFKRKPHGLCKIYFPNRMNLFVSYFNNGQPLFEDCLIIFETGSYYHGSLRNFKFHGFGKYVHYDKCVIIEGEWNNGRPVGKVKEQIVYGSDITEFDGYFNRESEKEGENCFYTIKRIDKEIKQLFSYHGGFKEDSFFGQSFIKINNHHHEMKGLFKKDNVEIEKLETELYHFTGTMDKLLREGTGKVKIKGSNRDVVCEGTIKDGVLNGPGSIIHEDGELEKCYWFDGIKIKHLRNFDVPSQLKTILERIEIYYSTSKTYKEMTKQLEEYFKSHRMEEVENSAKRLQIPYVFEMISKEKANLIATSTKSIPNEYSAGSNIKSSSKKELIIELERGKFLYVTSYTMERE